MQHYMHFALGFPAKKLPSQDIANTIRENHGWHPNQNVPGVFLVEFTEDCGGSADKDWSTIVIKDFGEIPNYGKLVSLSEFQQQRFILTADDEVIVRAEMKNLGIEHLFDQIQPIIYSCWY